VIFEFIYQQIIHKPKTPFSHQQPEIAKAFAPLENRLSA
jgi:hypothetical protein